MRKIFSIQNVFYCNIAAAVIISFLITGCKPQQQSSTQNENNGTGTDNSQNMPVPAGTYLGVLPCADCEGMRTTIGIAEDSTWWSQTIYHGKSDSVFISGGTFTIDAAGSKITLKKLDGNLFNIYAAGENKLTQLDQNGNPITGKQADQYILYKEFAVITEKYWKLVELYGQPVVMKGELNRESHMVLSIEGNRVSGNGGCNNFSGTYELLEGDRIKFSGMSSTLMACENMETEKGFMEVLGAADNYNVTADTLKLYKAKMAQLAKFEAVYFK